MDGENNCLFVSEYCISNVLEEQFFPEYKS